MRAADVIPASWPVPDRIGAFTTTRSGGTSRGAYETFNLALHVGDDPDAVAENRRRLQARCRCDAVQWLTQVHGTRCLAATAGTASDPVEADAAWTSEPGLALAVLTADCLPVAFCAPEQGVVAVAHAGWRGLVAGVLQSTLDALPVAADQCHGWIGPGIGAAAYEVGEDVASAVTDLGAVAAGSLEPGRAAGKYQLDLRALASRMLTTAGLRSVSVDDRCTAMAPELYSFRRDGVTGRMATVVWLEAGR